MVAAAAVVSAAPPTGVPSASPRCPVCGADVWIEESTVKAVALSSQRLKRG